MPYEETVEEVSVDCCVWDCECNAETKGYPECTAEVEVNELRPDSKECPHYYHEPEKTKPERFLILDENGSRYTKIEINKETGEIKRYPKYFPALGSDLEKWVVQHEDSLSNFKFCYYQGTLMAHHKDQMLFSFMDNVRMCHI